MSSVDHDSLLRADQLAERLGVKPATVLVWNRKGIIPSRRLSHKVLRFDLADVVAALEARRKPLSGSEGATL